MTKKELATAIAKQQNANVSVKQAEQMIDAVATALQDALLTGEEVQFKGFMTLKTAVKKAHEARNPATGETISIPERKVVKVAISKTFANKLNGINE